MISILHLGDITKINGAEAPIVDVITGGSPCQDLSCAGKRAGLAGERSGLFMEQMRIVKQMREASKQELISEFGENYDKSRVSPRYMVWENVCHCGTTLITTSTGYKYIKDVEVGELVRTHDGTYHKVLQTYKTEMQPTIKVKFQGGTVECTPNHPFLTEDLTYKPIGELKVGDRLGFKVDEPGTKSIGMPIAYAFGRWLADGSVAIRNDRKTKHRIFISTGYKKYESLKAELSKLPWQINEQKMDWAINFTFSSDEFGELTDSAGYGARNKQVPEWVFSLVAEERDEVLRGYLDGDGYQRTRSENHTECSFNTASEKLAYGIARLVRAVYHVGVSLSYKESTGTATIDGREVNAHGSWNCSFSIPNKYAHNLIGIAGASKYNNGYVWVKIREISEGETQDVYNLSVEDNNTYEANGIVCHNCGAFSSGTPAGADFQAVLEEVVKVVKPDCPRIPIPNTGWPSAGNLDGVGEDGTPFSVSWRVHNACMWGVPQRRRRISLIADFGGTSAPEILFERAGMPWNSESSSEERKRTSSATGTGIKESSTTGSVTFRKSSHAKNSEDGQGWEPTEVNDTLNTFDQGETRTSTLVVEDNVAKISNAPELEAIPIYNHPQGSELSFIPDGIAQTLTARAGTGGNNTPMVFENHSQDTRFTELGETCQTVSATWGMGGNNQPLVVKPETTDPESSAVVVENHPQDCRYRLKEDNIFPTMGARQGGEGDPNTLMVMETKKSEDAQDSDEPLCVQRRFSSVNIFDNGITPTLEAGAGEGGNNMPLVFDQNKSDKAYAFEPGAVKRLGQNFSEEVSPTLRAQMGDNQVSVVYGISAYDSNSMKSDNPHSGIYEADSARTLDNNGGNPACNQGGMAIVQQIDNKSAIGCDVYNGEITGDVSASLTTKSGIPAGSGPKVLNTEPILLESSQNHATVQTDGISTTLPAAMGEGGGYVPMVVQDAPETKVYGVTTKGNGDAFINPNTHTALSTGGGEPGQGYPCVLQVDQTPSYVQVETEVTVRKYPVDIENLKKCLRSHKTVSVDVIAEKLNKPKTLVEHWFRQDKCFAIPDADIWYQLKDLLNIETNEFDESITTFEKQVGKFDTQNRIHMGETSPTLCASGENTLYCVEKDAEVQSLELFHCTTETDMTHPLKARDYKDPQCVLAVDMGAGKSQCGVSEEQSPTLATTHGGEPVVAFTQNQREEVRDLPNCADNLPAEKGTHQQTYVSNAVVRRLTPLECERLQGFPDGWTDIGEWTDSKGKKHKDADSPRYKALGNSIALPFWRWMAGRMVDQLKKSGVEHPTMASLFDGIGGFPLVYLEHGCQPVWASEIEEFPMAVTKLRFGESDEPITFESMHCNYMQSRNTRTTPTNMVAIEGNGSRDSHKGDGYSETETMYTLNTVEQHAVSYQEVTGSLMASGYNKLDVQEAANDMYVVQKPDDTVGAICATDYKGIRNADIDEEKYVIQDVEDQKND